MRISANKFNTLLPGHWICPLELLHVLWVLKASGALHLNQIPYQVGDRRERHRLQFPNPCLLLEHPALQTRLKYSWAIKNRRRLHQNMESFALMLYMRPQQVLMQYYWQQVKSPKSLRARWTRKFHLAYILNPLFQNLQSCHADKSQISFWHSLHDLLHPSLWVKLIRKFSSLYGTCRQYLRIQWFLSLPPIRSSSSMSSGTL